MKLSHDKDEVWKFSATFPPSKAGFWMLMREQLNTKLNQVLQDVVYKLMLRDPYATKELHQNLSGRSVRRYLSSLPQKIRFSIPAM